MAAVIAGEVHAGLRHQGSQSRNEIERLEHDVGDAIATELSRLDHLTSGQQLCALLLVCLQADHP